MTALLFVLLIPAMPFDAGVRWHAAPRRLTNDTVGKNVTSNTIQRNNTNGTVLPPFGNSTNITNVTNITGTVVSPSPLAPTLPGPSPSSVDGNATDGTGNNESSAANAFPSPSAVPVASPSSVYDQPSPSGHPSPFSAPAPSSTALVVYSPSFMPPSSPSPFSPSSPSSRSGPFGSPGPSAEDQGLSPQPPSAELTLGYVVLVLVLTAVLILLFLWCHTLKCNALDMRERYANVTPTLLQDENREEEDEEEEDTTEATIEMTEWSA